MLVGHLQWSGGEEEMVGARLVWADFFFFFVFIWSYLSHVGALVAACGLSVGSIWDLFP